MISRDLSATLWAGEFTVLLGPNGAGKSTLLRTLCGLQAPLAGRVLLDGEAVATMSARARARRLGVVLTEQVKTWGLKAYDLVALGRQPHTGWFGNLADDDRRAIDQALGAAGARELAGREVAELSDGERQRVMIARALAQEPKALILDEVTAFLDLPRRVDIMRMLRRLAHDGDHALLLSTHDLDLALRTADRIWLMGSDGSFHAGSPEDLVLSGALNRVFGHEGLDFDPAEGAFRLHPEATRRVSLRADGLTGVWTRRALERLGFDVHGSEAATAEVEVLAAADGRPRWCLRAAEQSSEHHTIYDLSVALRGSTAGISTSGTTHGSGRARPASWP
jgi:iron complex transport system ATP-binding protein